MKDCQERELKIGQKVATTVNGSIVLGTVARVRSTKRYSKTTEVARVTLSKPIEKKRYVGYERDENGNAVVVDGRYKYIYEEMPPKVYHDCHYEDKILILDNLGE
jgi:hypothetical protein